MASITPVNNICHDAFMFGNVGGSIANQDVAQRTLMAGMAKFPELLYCHSKHDIEEFTTTRVHHI